jgi:hypothetical protein
LGAEDPEYSGAQDWRKWRIVLCNREQTELKDSVGEVVLYVPEHLVSADTKRSKLSTDMASEHEHCLKLKVFAFQVS